MPAEGQDFEKNVFINCPFDAEYKHMRGALIFTVVYLGFEPRIASERQDAGEVRLSKIRDLIKDSRFSIHDISRMKPLKERDHPRFNMPFELGLDFGCRAFGSDHLCSKKCLILEETKYSYQKVISDISGNDIEAHDNDPETLVRRVRNWMRSITRRKTPSGNAIWQSFNLFLLHFEEACKKLDYGTRDIEEMPIEEYISHVREWIKLERQSFK